ncbi:hypothetical protein DFP86_104138 [Paludibacterium purpuratum]|uniref:Uncharacterized protein n=2 Tax=Paludibacterium purpuratum TaxID=1144873 RepID=A0A4V3DVE6_9NEIS|nr:hypothetical protein DFP86_104138 [Paludibacterium purpuratum]
MMFLIQVAAFGGMAFSGGENLKHFTLLILMLWGVQLLLDWVVVRFVKETRRVLLRAFFMLLEGWVWLFFSLSINLLFYFFSPHKTSELKAAVATLLTGLLCIIISELMRVHQKMKAIGFDADFREGEREVVMLWKKRGFISARDNSVLAHWNYRILNYMLMLVAPLGMGGIFLATRLLANATGAMAICYVEALLMTPLTYILWSRAAINLYVNLYKPLRLELRTGKPVVYDKYPDTFRGLIGGDEF